MSGLGKLQDDWGCGRVIIIIIIIIFFYFIKLYANTAVLYCANYTQGPLFSKSAVLPQGIGQNITPLFSSDSILATCLKNFTGQHLLRKLPKKTLCIVCFCVWA